MCIDCIFLMYWFVFIDAMRLTFTNYSAGVCKCNWSYFAQRVNWLPQSSCVIPITWKIGIEKVFILDVSIQNYRVHSIKLADVWRWCRWKWICHATSDTNGSRDSLLQIMCFNANYYYYLHFSYKWCTQDKNCTIEIDTRAERKCKKKNSNKIISN